MKLVKLDHTGHTELDLDVESMIAELEKEMNTGRKSVVAEEPGKEPIYIREASQVRGLHEETQVTVMPQLAGG